MKNQNTSHAGQTPPDLLFLTPRGKEAWQHYQREIATYRRELSRLLQRDAGRFVLIKGEQVLGIWDSWSDACEAGREKFGLEPIFVKKIDARDPELFALLDARIAAQCPG